MYKVWLDFWSNGHVVKRISVDVYDRIALGEYRKLAFNNEIFERAKQWYRDSDCSFCFDSIKLTDYRLWKYETDLKIAEQKLEKLNKYVSDVCKNNPQHFAYPHDDINHCKNHIRNLKVLINDIERNKK